jgi:signal transduction histidine kinase
MSLSDGAGSSTRRFPIQVKLMVVVAVPLVSLLVGMVVKVAQASRAAQRARQQAELPLAAAGVDGLLGRLHLERDMTGLYLRDLEAPEALEVDGLGPARELTDEALDEFQAMFDTSGRQVRDFYRPALDAITGAVGTTLGLDDLRTKVDGYAGARTVDIEDPISSDTFEGYGELITLLSEGNDETSLAIGDVDLRRGTELIGLVNTQADTIAQLAPELLAVAVGPGEARPTPDARDHLNQISALYTQLQSTDATIQARAKEPYGPLIEELYASEQVQRFAETVQAALSSGSVDVEEVFAQATPSDTAGLGYRNLGAGVSEALEHQASSLVNQAERRQNLYLALGLAAVLAAAVVPWLVSRSLTRPLRSLTQQAVEVAHFRLPQAVQGILATPPGADVQLPRVDDVLVGSRDEVADVAAAVNAVQGSALELAAEHAALRRNVADSFVNLGRRNHDLLGRQLAFITELEQKETDPGALANLVRLDHLATRMRRNAESLLVLGGIDLMLGGVDPSRTTDGAVAVTDTILAALGEVEDYQRVEVRAVEPATILGSVAPDLTHLLAELIENALAFSPPDQTVEVRGRQHTGYTLAISDSGPGMSPDELARANRRLAGTESFTVAPSKYLGHYVVGKLAARHAIVVTLHNNRPPDDPRLSPFETATPSLSAPGPDPLLAEGSGPSAGSTGGITAIVSLPANVFTTPNDTRLRRSNPRFPAPYRRAPAAGPHGSGFGWPPPNLPGGPSWEPPPVSDREPPRPTGRPPFEAPGPTQLAGADGPDLSVSEPTHPTQSAASEPADAAHVDVDPVVDLASRASEQDKRPGRPAI